MLGHTPLKNLGQPKQLQIGSGDNLNPLRNASPLVVLLSTPKLPLPSLIRHHITAILSIRREQRLKNDVAKVCVSNVGKLSPHNIDALTTIFVCFC